MNVDRSVLLFYWSAGFLAGVLAMILFGRPHDGWGKGFDRPLEPPPYPPAYMAAQDRRTTGNPSIPSIVGSFSAN